MFCVGIHLYRVHIFYTFNITIHWFNMITVHIYLLIYVYHYYIGKQSRRYLYETEIGFAFGLMWTSKILLVLESATIHIHVLVDVGKFEYWQIHLNASEAIRFLRFNYIVVAVLFVIKLISVEWVSPYQTIVEVYCGSLQVEVKH